MKKELIVLDDVIWFSCSINQIDHATWGRILGRQFLVGSGSHVQSLKKNASIEKDDAAFKLRHELEKNGTICDDRFQVDYVFQNPSIALKVITATSKGNLNAWTDREGRTIKAMWEKATNRNQKDATKD